MTTVLKEKIEHQGSDKITLPEASPSISPEAKLEIGELSELMSYQFRRAHLRIYNAFAAKLDGANITPAQYGLLCKIKYNQGVSQTALAKANGIERSTLGEVIDRFEKSNLVERRKHQTDRRAYALYLTPEGDSLLRQILPLVSQHEKEMTGHWSAEDRQQFLTFLKRIAEGT